MASDLSHPTERENELGLAGDFFGIESDVGVKHVGNHSPPAIEKYAALVRKRDAMENDENFVQANYGTLRYDIDNIPKYHGMYENERLVSGFEDLAKSGVKFVGNRPLESPTGSAQRNSTIHRRNNKRVTDLYGANLCDGGQDPLKRHEESYDESRTRIEERFSTESAQHNISIDLRKNKSVTDIYGVDLYDGGQGPLKRHDGDLNYIDNQYFSETGNLNNGDGTTLSAINEQIHPDDSIKSTFQRKDFEDVAMKNICTPNVSTEVEENSSFSAPISPNSVKLNHKNNCHPPEPEVMKCNTVYQEQYFSSRHTQVDPFEIPYVKCQSTNTKHVKEQQQDRVDSSVVERDWPADCNEEDALDPFGVANVREMHEARTKTKLNENFDISNQFKYENLGKLYSDDDASTSAGIRHSQAISEEEVLAPRKNNRAVKYEINYDRPSHLMSSNKIKEKSEDLLFIKNAQQETSPHALEVDVNEYDDIHVGSEGKMAEELELQNTGTHGQPTSSEDGEPKTAFDFVKSLRKANKSSSIPTSGTGEDLDSKGFRILKNQVPNLDHMTRDEVLKMLKKSIIYNDNDIVAIDKPYGIICHGYTPGIDRKVLTSYLDDLAHFTDKNNSHPNLYMVHRLDKETTGVMLFAKTQQMANILKTLLANRKIQKIYWAITKGVPSPLEGIINIPIAEGGKPGKFKMALNPDVTEELKGIGKITRSSEAHEAITYYKVLCFKDNAALVHVRPETGLKHQVRVHLGQGLRCPILGDHKYSNFDKLAPQKLPDDMLTKLQVRQSKVRYIPMHLHSHCVIIPEILDGKNLFIESKLPVHFSKNLQSLKIRKQ